MESSSVNEYRLTKMSALQNFFRETRERNERMDALYSDEAHAKRRRIAQEEYQKAQELNLQKKVIETVKYLKVAIFLDYDDLIQYIYEVEEDVYQRILKNHLYEFPPHIQEILLEGMVVPKEVIHKIGFKIRHLTDKDMQDKESEKSKEFFRSLEKALKEYKIPDRPLGDNDEKLDELTVRLNTARKTKEFFAKQAKLKTMTGSYVPPAMRVEVLDPKTESAAQLVRTIENEITLLEIEILKENNEWARKKREEFIEEFSKMHQV
jgi:hypothetical protein